jgi:hypothetical protein
MSEKQLDMAPPHSLPDWAECSLRVDNSEFIAKRVAEGGYGADPDSMLAGALHRFIYEYDDADPYRSAWFMHRLELVVKEAKADEVELRRSAMALSAERAEYRQEAERLRSDLAAMREALEFYADVKRYHGANQRVEDGDRFTPAGYPYRIDVTRDNGQIARETLAKGGQP